MIKSVLLWGFRITMNLCYLPFRLLRPQRKIVYLSRQSNRISMDFSMLMNAVNEADPTVKQVVLCKTMGKGICDKVSYGFHLFAQMYHLATSKAAVLDGYCIGACLLHHRKSLKIFQLWHALGLLKNFGYAAVGSNEGSPEKTARIMRMHRGYHRIMCSSPHVIAGLARCYDAPEDCFLPIGLPRVDFLTTASLQHPVREKIFDRYPALRQQKPVILYAPTFRKNRVIDCNELIGVVDTDRYHLVIKQHDGTELVVTDKQQTAAQSGITGLEWLAVADYVITDYSAIVFEAMTARKKVILYCFDKEQYGVNRGFATPYDQIPAPQCKTAKEVAAMLEEYPCDQAKTEAFLEFHVTARHSCCTQALCDAVLSQLKK